ncbi:hypothetical protein Q672_13305 [Marinobacter sp. EVN1]|uniref:hypothetical protein n=1 Tax=Marinobacter sp. EVN1 TaxID=1397532 RepID=UPI0003B818A9|nr:hypothetical protein [Marinobacter sp. EVN1]ERS87056.1 hypothetical protein Q672_13305 [Marinobacter sp. EVN1]
MDIANSTSIGKHWAAIRNGVAVAVIPMTVPKDVDFEEYRRRALSTLELLGEVKTGEVLDDYGQRCFVKRPNHANRSTTPKPLTVFPIFQPSDVYQAGGAI